MPITSKYDNKEVEKVLTELLKVLEKNQTSAELSLMLLGNLATNIINTNLKGNQREVIAEKFAQVLISSINKE